MDKAAYIISQAACAMAELEAMKAANVLSWSAGNGLDYTADDFAALQDKYCIGHNAVIGHLYDR